MYLIMRKSNNNSSEKENSIKKSVGPKKIPLARSFISEQSEVFEEETRITKR